MCYNIRVLLVVCLLAISGFSIEFSEVVKKNISSQKISAIDIGNFNGTIYICGENTDEIQIVAYKFVRAKDEYHAKNLLEKVEVLFEEADNILKISADLPTRSSQQFFSFSSRFSCLSGVDFEIIVPRTMDLIVSSDNGKVIVKNVDGKICCHSKNGSVNGINISGEIELTSVNGHIDAFIDDEKVIKKITGESKNGSIHINISPSLGFKLEANTRRGYIYSDFPLKISEKYSGQKVNGVINGGGAEINLKTNNGSINLLRM